MKKAKGGADFADLAKSNSEDAGSATKGGDLDFFVRGQMVPEFEKSAFSMKINEISDIVTTQFGYHIIRLDDVRDAVMPKFEEVKPQIVQQIQQNKLAEFQQGLRDKAKIE